MYNELSFLKHHITHKTRENSHNDAFTAFTEDSNNISENDDNTSTWNGKEETWTLEETDMENLLDEQIEEFNETMENSYTANENIDVQETQPKQEQPLVMDKLMNTISNSKRKEQSKSNNAKGKYISDKVTEEKSTRTNTKNNERSNKKTEIIDAISSLKATVSDFRANKTIIQYATLINTHLQKVKKNKIIILMGVLNIIEHHKKLKY